MFAVINEMKAHARQFDVIGLGMGTPDGAGSWLPGYVEDPQNLMTSPARTARAKPGEMFVLLSALR